MRFSVDVAALLLLLAGIACSATAYTVTGNGEPGCKTPMEVNQVYANFWDPTKYWLCVGWNRPAIAVACEEGTAFSRSANGCIFWEIWVWEEPIMPPSSPDGFLGVVLAPELNGLPANNVPMVGMMGMAGMQ